MNRFIVTALTIVTGFFAMIFSLIMAVPLTIAAIFAGRKIQKEVRQMQQDVQFNATKGDAIEGEFEEVTAR